MKTDKLPAHILPACVISKEARPDIDSSVRSQLARSFMAAHPDLMSQQSEGGRFTINVTSVPMFLAWINDEQNIEDARKITVSIICASRNKRQDKSKQGAFLTIEGRQYDLNDFNTAELQAQFDLIYGQAIKADEAIERAQKATDLAKKIAPELEGLRAQLKSRTETARNYLSAMKSAKAGLEEANLRGAALEDIIVSLIAQMNQAGVKPKVRPIAPYQPYRAKLGRPLGSFKSKRKAA